MRELLSGFCETKDLGAVYLFTQSRIDNKLDMKMLFALFSLLGVILCEDIIDFSHIDSIQRTITAQSQPFQVVIDLQQTKPDNLFFPSSCSLTDSLQNKASFESDQILNLHEQQLSGLKDIIRELLRLSELIKSSKKNIEQSYSFGESISSLQWSLRQLICRTVTSGVQSQEHQPDNQLDGQKSESVDLPRNRQDQAGQL